MDRCKAMKSYPIRTEKRNWAKLSWNQLFLVTFVIGFAATLAAQKVKVGYDKGVDFSKFKTYTRLEPSTPPTRPVLYKFGVNSIDSELSAKGLQRVDKWGAHAGACRRGRLRNCGGFGSTPHILLRRVTASPQFHHVDWRKRWTR